MDTNEELARMLERLRDRGKPQGETPPQPEKARKTDYGWQLPVQPGDFAPEDEWERIRQRVARDAQLADERQRSHRPTLPSWILFLFATLSLVVVIAVVYTYSR